MAGIATSLKNIADLEVVCIDPHSPADREALKKLDPTAIAFDLTDPTIGLDISLLRERPGLLLIGVDPSCDELLVMSCHTPRALSIADLVEVLDNQEPFIPISGGKKSKRGK
jgi:hypothetical protein